MASETMEPPRTPWRRCVPLLLALMLPAPVGAQTPAERAESERLIAQAVVHYRAGRVAEALAKFRAGEPHAADRAGVRYNIGRCLQALERPKSALEVFESIRDMAGVRPDLLARVDQRIAEVEERWFGALAVSCDGAGAEVRVTSMPGRTWPCPATVTRVAAGLLTVSGVTVDGRTARRSVRLAPGEVAPIELAFPPPPSSARVNPPERAERPPDGGPGIAGYIEPTSPSAAPLVMMIAGGLVAVGGGISLGIASAQFDDASALHTDYEAATAPGDAERLRGQAEDALDSGETARVLGYGLIGVGGAALIAGVIWAAGQPSTDTAVRWVPAGNGVALRGAW